MQPVLLDTCAVVFLTENKPIRPEATNLLNEAYAANVPTYISPITAWEIGLLVARERIQLLITPQRWFARLFDAPSVKLADMPPDLMINSSFLPGKPPRDPADRIIAATARELGATLVTRDEAILDYAKQGHLNAMAC